MIGHISHSRINKKKWDECIEHSQNSLIYAYSWYLDVVCPNWEALVEDDYKSVMPLTTRKKYGIEYLYPPYFTQQLGIFSKEKTSRQKVEEFLNAIPSRYKFLEINLNIYNTFELSGFQVKKNINIELSLDSSYEWLRKKFSEDTRRNIKKAVKYSIKLRKEIPPAELISIFRKNTGKKINNLTDKNYNILLRLINTCIQKGFAQVWGAFSEGKLCAGVVWLIKGNRSIFLFSATDQQAKKTGAMFYLIDKFIQEYAGSKMILDFEGSNLPGLARFYKGFGSEEYVYLQIRKNNLPKIIKWIKEIK
ncbi:MAG: GNAT family N-acetyltransferase [Bacteroidetes bacterium]|nr:MAG: GNAT family N-acetyltransferase [Bacteroidota bacterium]